MAESFKKTIEDEPESLNLKKYGLVEFGAENIEIKKLTKKDEKEVRTLLRKALLNLRDYDSFLENSYGAFLERMLIGVILVREEYFKDELSLRIYTLSLLLQYDSEIIRQRLIKRVEKEGYKYIFKVFDIPINKKQELYEDDEAKLFLKLGYKPDVFHSKICLYKRF